MFKSFESACAYLGNKTDRPFRYTTVTKGFTSINGYSYPDHVHHHTPRATRIVKTDKGIGVRYHETIVVEYTPDGIILNSGGWRTATTKERFNDALFALSNNYKRKVPSVYQDHGVWFISGHVFFDGILISYKGKILNLPTKKQDEKRLAESKRLAKLIKEYCDQVKYQLETRVLQAPSAGDCLFCALRTVDTHQTLGDATKNHEHLIDHLEESYIVPSLVMNAVKHYGSIYINSAMAEYFSHDPRRIAELPFGMSLIVRDVPRMVRRYLKLRLGLADR